MTAPAREAPRFNPLPSPRDQDKSRAPSSHAGGSKADTPSDRAHDKGLDFAIYLLPDSYWNRDVGSPVQLSSTIVRVAVGASETGQRVKGRPTASGRPGNDGHTGRH